MEYDRIFVRSSSKKVIRRKQKKKQNVKAGRKKEQFAPEVVSESSS